MTFVRMHMVTKGPNRRIVNYWKTWPALRPRPLGTMFFHVIILDPKLGIESDRGLYCY
jgi:hypothetical protein